MAGTDIKEIDYDQIIVKASQIANAAILARNITNALMIP